MKFIARFESTQLLAIPIDFGTCIKSRTVKVVTGPAECTADNSTSLSSVDKLFQNGGLDLNVLTFWNVAISQRASARLNSRKSCLEVQVPYFYPEASLYCLRPRL